MLSTGTSLTLISPSFSAIPLHPLQEKLQIEFVGASNRIITGHEGEFLPVLQSCQYMWFEQCRTQQIVPFAKYKCCSIVSLSNIHASFFRCIIELDVQIEFPSLDVEWDTNRRVLWNEKCVVFQ